MKVFIFEYVTGGGLLTEPLSASLAEEGDLMLRALLADFAELPGMQTVTLRDARLDGQVSTEVHKIYHASEFHEKWMQLLNSCDAVWPIAPETNGELCRLCQDVIDNGKILLNSPPEAVQLTARKAQTAAVLAEHGIPVVLTLSCDSTVPEFAGRWVLKPDNSAGCEGTYIGEGCTALENEIRRRGACNELIVQPLIEGQPISLCMLCMNGHARVLSCNTQQLSIVDNAFKLNACVVGQVQDDGGKMQTLAERICMACPELWGFVGVDLILSLAGPLVLEINPRLTTSYVGLKASTGINPAALVLQMSNTGELPEVVVKQQRPITVTLGKSKSDVAWYRSG